jgi:hypothetical protein
MQTSGCQHLRTVSPYVVLVLAIHWELILSPVMAEQTTAQPDHAETIQRALAAGKLCFRLTTAEDIKGLLGPPTEETTQGDGGMEKLLLEYDDVKLSFSRMRNRGVPFTLLFVIVHGRALDIGQGKQIVLRNAEDLKKFDPFWGFSNVSLKNVDLRDHLTLIQSMPFNSRTVWPESSRLPQGFDPAQVFEQGKNPGLGIRALHKQGINGTGVGIAIIDQPMAQDHLEYAHRIKQYKAIEVQGVPPQMHGPGVTSIAVGKQCGVAPAATLYYYAVPMWKWKKCEPYGNIIHSILQLNHEAKPTERIRVVSISTGMFPSWEDYEDWQATLQKAKEQGVIVLTCSTRAIRYMPVKRAHAQDPEDPNSYISVIARPGADLMMVPAGNRTTASHEGADVFTYWTEAGMSWATPYLAGLAALACQVDPRITPDKIFELWQDTAVRTQVGVVVNPQGFITRVQASRVGD